MTHMALEKLHTQVADNDENEESEEVCICIIAQTHIFTDCRE